MMKWLVKVKKLIWKMLLKNYKTKGINLIKNLYKPNVPENTPLKNNTKQDHNLENVIDFTILKEANLAIEKKVKMSFLMKLKIQTELLVQF